jgi:hypothetical protein
MNFRLRNLPLGAKLGILCAVIVLFGGYEVAAIKHLVEHHSPRDGVEGFSLSDVEGVYHGLNNPSRLLTMLEQDHAPDLAQDDRAILIDWLQSADVAANYDNLDFAAFTPEEIITANCLDCHGRTSAVDQGAGIALATWSEIQRFAFPIVVNPADEAIMLASMHAHAPVMAMITITVALLACMAGWAPGWLRGVLIFFAGAALLVDIGSWFPARTYASLTLLILGGGVVHSGAMGLLMVIVAVELLLPRHRESGAGS